MVRLPAVRSFAFGLVVGVGVFLVAAVLLTPSHFRRPCDCPANDKDRQVIDEGSEPEDASSWVPPPPPPPDPVPRAARNACIDGRYRLAPQAPNCSKCVESYFGDDQHSRWYAPPPTRAQLHQLPRLAMATTFDADFYNIYKADLSAMMCYCARHNVPLFTESIDLQKDRHMSRGRFRGVEKYLPYYQWLIAIDIDVHPLNYSASISDALRNDEAFDIVAFERNNHEVMAGSVAIHNTPGARAFMRAWLAMSDKGQPNWPNLDQGDLLRLVLRVFLPEAYNACLPLFEKYKEFGDCFHSHWKGHLEMHGAIDGVPVAMRVYPVFSGWFRLFEPLWGLPYNVSFAGDVLGHGKHHYRTLTNDDIYCRIAPDGTTAGGNWATSKQIDFSVDHMVREGYLEANVCHTPSGNRCVARKAELEAAKLAAQKAAEDVKG